MTDPLSLPAQVVLDACDQAFDQCGTTAQGLAAALRAAADQVVPVRAWHESDNDAAWQRHQMSVIINRRILAIAAELEGAN
jgi:hypothetical protein